MGYLAPPATLVHRTRSHLQTAGFVRRPTPFRLWADTFPWDTMVQAVSQALPTLSPKAPRGGPGPPVAARVLLALETG